MLFWVEYKTASNIWLLEMWDHNVLCLKKTKQNKNKTCTLGMRSCYTYIKLERDLGMVFILRFILLRSLVPNRGCPGMIKLYGNWLKWLCGVMQITRNVKAPFYLAGHPFRAAKIADPQAHNASQSGVLCACRSTIFGERDQHATKYKSGPRDDSSMVSPLLCPRGMAKKHVCPGTHWHDEIIK